jgi:predicted ATPase
MKDHGYLRAVRLKREEVPSLEAYPFSIPAVRNLERLEFSPGLTILIGENGIGKSTLIEAIAVKWGFNAEGGSRNFRFQTRDTHSILKDFLVLERGVARATDGFFLRAESFYGLATEVDRLDSEGGGFISYFGDRSLHEQSHGEAFLSLLQHRLVGGGLYIFDEPEAALSPRRLLSVLVILKRLLDQRSQIIMATHSPILMGFPGAVLYELRQDGISRVEYEDTDHYQITKDFLNARDRTLRYLLEDEPG